jgi:hypothetical protein
MRRRNVVILAVGLALAGVIAAVGGLAAIVYFGFTGFGHRQATGDERQLVITAASLGRLGVELDPKAEKLTSKRSLDGAREIECEYEKDEVFFVSNAEIHRRARDAKESFTLTIGAWKTGLALGTDANLEEAQTLLAGGDDRYAGYIKNSGEIVGNVFIVRNGRVLHTLLITGHYLDDPDDVRVLIEPLLAESTRRYGT